MSTTNKSHLPYSVNLWGSHPDTGNDDCNTGLDFATLAEALAAFADVDAMLRKYDAETSGGRMRMYYAGWAFAELDGPHIHDVKANPDQRAVRARRRDNARGDREWQSEIANQAGMAFGCDGYNDAMGF